MFTQHSATKECKKLTVTVHFLKDSMNDVIKKVSNLETHTQSLLHFFLFITHLQ